MTVVKHIFYHKNLNDNVHNVMEQYLPTSMYKKMIERTNKIEREKTVNGIHDLFQVH